MAVKLGIFINAPASYYIPAADALEQRIIDRAHKTFARFEAKRQARQPLTERQDWLWSSSVSTLESYGRILHLDPYQADIHRNHGGKHYDCDHCAQRQKCHPYNYPDED